MTSVLAACEIHQIIGLSTACPDARDTGKCRAHAVTCWRICSLHCCCTGSSCNAVKLLDRPVWQGFVAASIGGSKAAQEMIVQMQNKYAHGGEDRPRSAKFPAGIRHSAA